ncbi:hypothetical protein TD95_003238 [Thielaviopsis punctulata]|uniref:Phospholipase/carboxylesterase/thioesterase domain-containing protein n=1 Tax=Thielaviopsis punctulata TaxID=72032 RepID=A0A0F4ZBC1_9PEZI|nr:hypothetical protein TD95_003238 [Thielaviopsis punctulata]
MASTKVPSEEDFSTLSLPHSLHFHSRPSTTSIILFFHGLGDSHLSFSAFARSLNIPNTLSITPRGPSPLPAFLADDSDSTASPGHFHWGDDVLLSASGTLDPDPGFTHALGRVWNDLIRAILIRKCGWTTRDILLFGYGQGGSFALALALYAARQEDGGAFQGVVSLGGPMPMSAATERGRVDASVLMVQVGEEEEEVAKRHFTGVQVVKWKRREVDMPRNREEMLPIMQFIASSLRRGW